MSCGFHCRTFTSLVKFILFYVFESGIVSLIFLPNSLLLVYMDETGFCPLIWYPAIHVLVDRTGLDEPIPVNACLCVQLLSHVLLFETPWAVACQAPLTRRFSRQEYWSRLPFSTPGDLPDSGVEPLFLVPPALAGRFTITMPPSKMRALLVESLGFSISDILSSASRDFQVVLGQRIPLQINAGDPRC